MGAFRRLGAWDELELDRAARELAALLAAKGLSAADAAALAHNAATVWLAAVWEQRPASPMEVLSLYSLGELAELCGQYRRFLSGEEWAINASFEGVAV